MTTADGGRKDPYDEAENTVRKNIRKLIVLQSQALEELRTLPPNTPIAETVKGAEVIAACAAIEGDIGELQKVIDAINGNPQKYRISPRILCARQVTIDEFRSKLKGVKDRNEALDSAAPAADAKGRARGRRGSSRGAEPPGAAGRAPLGAHDLRAEPAPERAGHQPGGDEPERAAERGEHELLGDAAPPARAGEADGRLPGHEQPVAAEAGDHAVGNSDRAADGHSYILEGGGSRGAQCFAEPRRVNVAVGEDAALVKSARGHIPWRGRSHVRRDLQLAVEWRCRTSVELKSAVAQVPEHLRLLPHEPVEVDLAQHLQTAVVEGGGAARTGDAATLEAGVAGLAAVEANEVGFQVLGHPHPGGVATLPPVVGAQVVVHHVALVPAAVLRPAVDEGAARAAEGRAVLLAVERARAGGEAAEEADGPLAAVKVGEEALVRTQLAEGRLAAGGEEVATAGADEPRRKVLLGEPE
ncbi:syntaxin-plants SYP6 [Babesia caballi]|uniref:Syntaxin-plants SYP6 n=1 Tax=Babesia caballi TaxID=5871 RepID=A0AAV4LSY2_BABCB|nr:syntaxin-plants SYP6 [Babesia caballi]